MPRSAQLVRQGSTAGPAYHTHTHPITTNSHTSHHNKRTHGGEQRDGCDWHLSTVHIIVCNTGTLVTCAPQMHRCQGTLHSRHSPCHSCYNHKFLATLKCTNPNSIQHLNSNISTCPQQSMPRQLQAAPHNTLCNTPEHFPDRRLLSLQSRHRWSHSCHHMLVALLPSHAMHP